MRNTWESIKKMPISLTLPRVSIRLTMHAHKENRILIQSQCVFHSILIIYWRWTIHTTQNTTNTNEYIRMMCAPVNYRNHGFGCENGKIVHDSKNMTNDKTYNFIIRYKKKPPKKTTEVPSGCYWVVVSWVCRGYEVNTQKKPNVNRVYEYDMTQGSINI